jgi:hypothetical protein
MRNKKEEGKGGRKEKEKERDERWGCTSLPNNARRA